MRFWSKEEGRGLMCGCAEKNKERKALMKKRSASSDYSKKNH